MTRVLVVDDHPLVRRGLVTVLSGDRDIEVVGEADSGEAALVLTAQLSPQVVVLDDHLPGTGGIETARILLGRLPELTCILMISHPNVAALMRARAAGVAGIVLKRSDPAVLRDAVRSVALDASFIDPALAREDGRARAGAPHGLTTMEMRVLEKVPQGLSNAEIGEALGIGHNTVKTHMRNAMQKIGASHRSQAAAIVIREGLA